jgi:hypothetical protein
MNEELKEEEWIQTPQISELFSMARTPISQAVDGSLKYPQLELSNVKPKDANEFVNYKKENLFLRPYSSPTLNGINDEVLKMINKEKLEKIQEERRKEKEAKEAEEQLTKKIQQLLNSAKEALENTDFETARNCYEKLDKLNFVGFDLTSKLNDIESKETKYLANLEDQRRLEEVLKSEDIGLIDKFLKDYPLSFKKQELEIRLSRLKASSGIPLRLKELTDWKMFCNEAPRWKKKVNDNGEFVKFEAEFKEVVEKIVRIQFESEKTKKPWFRGTFELNPEWKKATEWLGQERAKKLHDELTTKQ